MKKFVAFFFASIIMVQSFAAVNVELPARKATEIMMPLGTSGKTVSLHALTTMSAKEYQTLTGKNLKFSEKLAFKVAQKELRKTINRDGTVDMKKMESLSKKMQKAAVDNKKNLRLALILLGVALILSIIGSFVPFVWILASLAWLAGLIFLIIWLVGMAG
jgi:Flp pilus assembly protein TadB